MVDLGASTLLPGLINAHCHLDFTRFKGAISARQSFTEWIKNDQRAAALVHHAGLHRLDRGGLRAAGRGRRHDRWPISRRFPELLPHLPVPPLRTWWFLELIDVRSRINEDETLLGALSFFEKHPEWLGGFGLSPHAPYTASVDLYRLARTCGEKYGMLSTTHIAESVEEHEMFSHARGPLYDFLGEPGPGQLRLRAGLGAVAPGRAWRHRAATASSRISIICRITITNWSRARARRSSIARSATPILATRRFR